MSVDDIEGASLASMRAAFRSGRKTRRDSVARRTKLEGRRALSEHDGRRSRGGGIVRDVQLGLKIAAETKVQLLELAKSLDLSMVEVVERGIALVAAETAKQGGKTK